MAVTFGTKAETLARLESVLVKARVLPQEKTNWSSWSADRNAVISRIAHHSWLEQPLIIRSSAHAEDRAGESLAGHFLSIPNVRGRAGVEDAVGRVFNSYGTEIGPDDQVLIQPFLDDVTASGVAFSQDPNSAAPYVVINYSCSAEASAVTGGGAAHLETFYFWKHSPIAAQGFLGEVVALVRELEVLLQTDAIDIEFAVSAKHGLCLLQARPLKVTAASVDPTCHKELLTRIARRIETGSMPHPYLHGRRSMFGVMPDWNPAEIIGTRPRPLALSLYRSLITDQIWAYQRSNYGYKNLRSFPLLVSFGGLPYVDVRVSFNSFVPSDIEADLADRLVDYYLARLQDSPALHDKVEFEIVFSCYTLDLPGRLAALKTYGFSDRDIRSLTDSLRRLTNRIIHSDGDLWRTDLRRIRELESRRRRVLDSHLDYVSRIYWLLEDCKRWGTLPFAGLARAGFIAMQMLRSMVTMGILNDDQYATFLANLDTVTSHMMRDLRHMERPEFLEHYGHLRPGTYDILSPRYDETPDRYLGGNTQVGTKEKPPEDFHLTTSQKQSVSVLLAEHGLDMEADEVFDFIKLAVQGRERAKFLFTRSLSDALGLLKELGQVHGLDVDDMSFADISAVEELYASAADPGDYLRRSIAVGRERYRETCQIMLPPLISDPAEVWSFHQPPSEPNYVTQGVAEGVVQTCDGPVENLRGAIVLIANADPGFDWIFSKGIAGLVTAYGGINSHMAIRAGECGLPAVIGAGETLFQSWLRAKRLRVDCANRRVEVLQ